MEILSLEQRSAAPIKRLAILCRHTNSVEMRTGISNCHWLYSSTEATFKRPYATFFFKYK